MTNKLLFGFIPYDNKVVSGEVIPKDEIEADVFDFRSLFEKLENAIKEKNKAKDLATEIVRQGGLKFVAKQISGGNTKDLANSINHLGFSLEIIQAIIETILKVERCKSDSLRPFYDAITEKIIQLESNSNTLDKNDQSANDAILHIARNLKQQILEKTQQAETLRKHDYEISQLHQEHIVLTQKFDEMEQKCERLHASFMELHQNLIKINDKTQSLTHGINDLELVYSDTNRNLETLQIKEKLRNSTLGILKSNALSILNFIAFITMYILK